MEGLTEFVSNTFKKDPADDDTCQQSVKCEERVGIDLTVPSKYEKDIVSPDLTSSKSEAADSEDCQSEPGKYKLTSKTLNLNTFECLIPQKLRYATP